MSDRLALHISRVDPQSANHGEKKFLKTDLATLTFDQLVENVQRRFQHQLKFNCTLVHVPKGVENVHDVSKHFNIEDDYDVKQLSDEDNILVRESVAEDYTQPLPEASAASEEEGGKEQTDEANRLAKTVHVTNLPNWTKRQEVYTQMQRFGAIERVWTTYRGWNEFAFVTYEDPAIAQKARDREELFVYEIGWKLNVAHPRAADPPSQKGRKGDHVDGKSGGASYGKQAKGKGGFDYHVGKDGKGGSLYFVDEYRGRSRSPLRRVKR